MFCLHLSVSTLLSRGKILKWQRKWQLSPPILIPLIAEHKRLRRRTTLLQAINEIEFYLPSKRAAFHYEAT